MGALVKSVFKYYGRPSCYLLVQSQQMKHQNNEWKLFKVNDRHQADVNHVVLVNDVVLISLLLPLKKFHIKFWCFALL